MTIVSDTTPIISLIKINHLDLLKKLFGEVIIPGAVFNELTASKTFCEEADIVRNAGFLKTFAVQNIQSVKILQTLSGLDDGESEAIVLAGEHESNLLIIDERKGRKVAQKLGIAITGTVGILLQAHYESLISSDEVRKSLEILRNSNVRLSDSLIKEALSLL